MADDIILNKAANIERCLARGSEEYVGHAAELETSFTRQDAIVLNLLRACKASIDLAMHVVRIKRLGIPQTSRDAFDLLYRATVIDQSLAERMKRMVGFRNIAIHNYQVMDLGILRAIIEQRLNDFREFTAVLLRGNESASKG